MVMKWKLLISFTLCLGLLAVVSSQGHAAPAAPAAGVEFYNQQHPQMKSTECVKCHYGVFAELRDKGGAHQLLCRNCHVQFHTFKQGVAWEDRVPACSMCHSAVHGDKMIDCLECHTNVHAPIHTLINNDLLVQNCETCHEPAANDLRTDPSAHAELGCCSCHQERHGYLPNCNECHTEPHTTYVDNASCTNCHPYHSALNISFPEDLGNIQCDSCHDEVVEKLAQSPKLHTELNCVFCHAEQHGNIPECQECHGDGPHNPKLLERFTGCLDCHGDPHSLTLEAK